MKRRAREKNSMYDEIIAWKNGKPKKFRWVLENMQHMCEPVYNISTKRYATMKNAIEDIEKYGPEFKVRGRLEEK